MLKRVLHAVGLSRAAKPGDGKRSAQWPTVRKHHLERQPCCQVCGSDKGLEVHHIRPFHLHPKLELDPANLITLCEGTRGGCHFLFGHLENWHSFNPNVVSDAAAWREKIAHRPAA